MSAKAELKHTAALFALAVGGLSVIVAAVVAFVAVNSDSPGWLGCTAVAALFGAYQIRSGVRLRNKAIAEGASLFEEPGTGHTSRTGTRKPPFLRHPKPPSEEE
jgi:hypothetical protein